MRLFKLKDQNEDTFQILKKRIFIVKPELSKVAQGKFRDLQVKIATSHKFSAVVIKSTEEKQEFIQKKLKCGLTALKRLEEPHLKVHKLLIPHSQSHNKMNMDSFKE